MQSPSTTAAESENTWAIERFPKPLHLEEIEIKKIKRSPLQTIEIKKKAKKVDHTAEHLSVPLPATGIDYPFIKKRPIFIKDAPNFEPLWFKQVQKFIPIDP